MADAPPRHYLVWPEPDDAGYALAAGWFGRGLPAVVRRTEGATESGIPVGIPLSPRRGRRRIALTLTALREVRPPLALWQAIPSAPAAWQKPLTELAAECRAAGMDLRVYGSLAWQHLTGESYLTDRSDVDLLVQPPDRPRLDLALTMFQAWEHRTGLRADGEILFPDGAAVAWRELPQARNRVLVKSARLLELRPVADLLGLFEREAA